MTSGRGTVFLARSDPSQVDRLSGWVYIQNNGWVMVVTDSEQSVSFPPQRVLRVAWGVEV